MVLSLLILPSILIELYKVKNFKSHFFINLSIKFFQILDLSCSNSTLKKLLKSFPRHIFSFRDIIKDRCDLVWNRVVSRLGKFLILLIYLTISIFKFVCPFATLLHVMLRHITSRQTEWKNAFWVILRPLGYSKTSYVYYIIRQGKAKLWTNTVKWNRRLHYG